MGTRYNLSMPEVSHVNICASWHYATTAQRLGSNIQVVSTVSSISNPVLTYQRPVVRGRTMQFHALRYNNITQRRRNISDVLSG